MFFVSIGSHAQFIDPVLSGTVAAGDAAKKKSLDGIKDKQNKIAALQTTIAANMYLANLHTSFLCNLIYPTFSRILLYSC